MSRGASDGWLGAGGAAGGVGSGGRLNRLGRGAGEPGGQTGQHNTTQATHERTLPEIGPQLASDV